MLTFAEAAVNRLADMVAEVPPVVFISVVNLRDNSLCHRWTSSAQPVFTSYVQQAPADSEEGIMFDAPAVFLRTAAPLLYGCEAHLRAENSITQRHSIISWMQRNAEEDPRRLTRNGISGRLQVNMPDKLPVDLQEAYSYAITRAAGIVSSIDPLEAADSEDFMTALSHDVGNDDARDAASGSAVHRLIMDVWGLIADFLPYDSLLQLPIVHRRLCNVRDGLVWRRLFTRLFPVVQQPAFGCCRKYTVLLLRLTQRYTGFAHPPSLRRFTRAVCPKGTVAFGRVHFQLVESAPFQCTQISSAKARAVQEDFPHHTLTSRQFTTAMGLTQVHILVHSTNRHQARLALASVAWKRIVQSIRDLARVSVAVTNPDHDDSLSPLLDVLRQPCDLDEHEEEEEETGA
jgi:hypothetical protein